jgi:hypothetical protein
VLDIRNLESESSSDELQWPEKELVKLDKVVNAALFRCTEGLIFSYTTQLGTTRVYMQCLQYWVREFHLCSQIVLTVY